MSPWSHSVGHRTPTSFILGIALWLLLTLFQCLHCRTMQFLSGRIAKTTQHGYAVPLFCQIMSSERLWLFFFFSNFFFLSYYPSQPQLPVPHSFQHPHNFPFPQDPLFLHFLSEKDMSLRDIDRVQHHKLE